MKTIKFLFSPIFMGVMFVMLAVSMAVATFTENDFGAETARAIIYNSHWFELIFLLLVVNLTGQIFIFKLYRSEKLTVMLFHIAFIVMIAGAAITRFKGYEGSMHIREGNSSSVTYSSERHLIFDVVDSDGKLLARNSKKFTLTPLKHDRYNKSLMVGGDEINLKYNGFYNNVVTKVENAPGGKPYVSLLITEDMVTSETFTLSQGEIVSGEDFTIGFGTDADIEVNLRDSEFYLSSNSGIRLTHMTDRKVETAKADSAVVLDKGIVYSFGGYRLVLLTKTLSGSLSIRPVEEGETGSGALEFNLSVGSESKKIYLLHDFRSDDTQWKGMAGGKNIIVTYGSRAVPLPFNITLDDFILERYPGSNSPSGYRSRVTLKDKGNNKDFQYDIYMNHILKYKGYRFFQSSFDKDEKGTVLSVNHDRAGMLTTYTGYALLFLFIILSIINPKSVFRTVTPGLWNSRLRKTLVVLLLLSGTTLGNNVTGQELVVPKKHADAFGEVLSQDQKGRTKPLYTISSDILRKVARENDLNGLSPMQVFLGYSFDFIHWQSVPVIKISNPEIRKIAGINGDKAAFSQLVDFNAGGNYKLQSYVGKAYSKKESERSRFDKEVIKIDERLNIIYMVGRGDFLNLFPLRDGTDKWGSSDMAVNFAKDTSEAVFIGQVVPMWLQSATSAVKTGAETGDYIEALINYQRKYASYDLPTTGMVRAEVFYYKAKIFEKLFPFYATLGLVMIISLLVSVISGKKEGTLFMKILFALALTGFFFHTLGLAVRWYISGHVPMSNGYESLLFISWVTVLAGFIFSRKSLLALAATSVLGGMTLMVAHLSFMDPEITNLVPVLKSYWLTLHVSVITGSYGFLGLGAILGLIVLIMILFSNQKNRQRISATIDEITVINYKTITLGLYFLTIGTFLGAVWANESWGRYWGWDPKETWSLITIIIYTLVTHSRLIPGMKDVFTFNVISLFAFSSVLMTYFGVNYYLSGLHSYAAGDPVPVPTFVYITIIVLVTMSVLSLVRYRRWKERA